MKSRKNTRNGAGSALGLELTDDYEDRARLFTWKPLGMMLAALTIGLKSVVMEDRIEKLWVEAGGRLDSELEYVERTLGRDSGGINQMLIQVLI